MSVAPSMTVIWKRKARAIRPRAISRKASAKRAATSARPSKTSATRPATNPYLQGRVADARPDSFLLQPFEREGQRHALAFTHINELGLRRVAFERRRHAITR